MDGALPARTDAPVAGELMPAPEPNLAQRLAQVERVLDFMAKDPWKRPLNDILRHYRVRDWRDL